MSTLADTAASDFLAARSGRCERLNMNLTPEGCMRLRCRTDPPEQCDRNCPGIMNAGDVVAAPHVKSKPSQWQARGAGPEPDPWPQKQDDSSEDDALAEQDIQPAEDDTPPWDVEDEQDEPGAATEDSLGAPHETNDKDGLHEEKTDLAAAPKESDPLHNGSDPINHAEGKAMSSTYTAEEFLASSTGHCGHLNMRLTPESCARMRNREADKGGPPSQCETCPGIANPGDVIRAGSEQGSSTKGKIVKNKLSDLNDHLFAQLERLNNEDLKGEALHEEIDRAQAVTGVAREIIANGNLVLKARIVMETNLKGGALPAMLEM